MEFWGVEVKAGETLKVKPGYDKLLHISQATLGELKKGEGTEFSSVFVNFGNQKLVLGSLSANCPQLSFDLVFEKEFELSHTLKNGSVYFMGYKNTSECSDDDSSDSFGDYWSMPRKDIKSKPESQVAKATETVVKSNVQVIEPIEDEDDSDESDYLDSDEDLDGAGDVSGDSEDEDEDEDEDDSEEDEETPTPKKAVGNKKGPAESATKTVPAKKAKAASPQKTDGKKGGHTATPHPAKKNAAKTNNADKAKTSKSGKRH